MSQGWRVCSVIDWDVKRKCFLVTSDIWVRRRINELWNGDLGWLFTVNQWLFVTDLFFLITKYIPRIKIRTSNQLNGEYWTRDWGEKETWAKLSNNCFGRFIFQCPYKQWELVACNSENVTLFVKRKDNYFLCIPRTLTWT